MCAFATVSRIVARSSSLEMDLLLDVAVDIYPIHAGQNLTVQIVSSLGGPNADADKEAWRMDGGGGLADEFDYVMHGKVRGQTVLRMELFRKSA